MRIHRSSIAVASSLLAALALIGCDANTDPGPGQPQDAPEAAFQASPTQGTAPFTVHFTDLSSGATSWLWDFGDGGVSNEQNPQHVFAGVGSFNVRLTVQGPGGQDSELKPGLVQTTAAIGDPDFEQQTAGLEPGAPWQVFLGTVPGAPGKHVIRSVAPGPAELGMPSAGVQWCELSTVSTDDATPPDNPGGITNPPLGGAGISQGIHYPAGRPVLQLDVAFVNEEYANASPQPDWMSVDISDGTTTRNLYFKDIASGTAGLSSIHAGALATPVETVTADLQQLFPQSSSATPFVLTVQVGNATDDFLASWGYVDNLRFEAAAAPVAAMFMADKTLGGVGTVFAFDDQSSGAPKTWVWDFGDGSVSTLQNPAHSYASQGTYDVSLRATAPGAGDLLVKQAFITIDNSQCEQAALQVISGSSCVAPADFVTFQNDSINASAYFWDFGDGQCLFTTSKSSQAHQYTQTGTYDVRLTAFGDVGNNCFGDPPGTTPPCGTVPGTGDTTAPMTIQVVALPSVDFTLLEPTVTCTPPGFFGQFEGAAYKGKVVTLTGSQNPGSGPITKWSWTATDGFNAPNAGSTVTHPFVLAGTFDITLTAENACGQTTQVTKTIKVAETWTTVRGFLNSSPCSSCHDGSFAFAWPATYPAPHTMDFCSVGPTHWTPTSCSPTLPSSDPSLSGLVKIQGFNAACQNHSSYSLSAAGMTALKDWIDFGAGNN